MSNFDQIFKVTMGHEGGYVNDPDDAGGETYKGISRRYNASWKGWDIIDYHKERNKAEFPKCLDNDEDLQEEVFFFYKERYFDPYEGDYMPIELGMEMFDTSVNMGVGRAVKFLQSGLNLLNRNGTMYQDQIEDGDYGPTTAKCLEAFLANSSSQDVYTLLKIMNVLQGMHYIEYMRKSPVQEKYARGWFNRVSITKR